MTHGRPPGRTMREKRRSRVPQAIRAHTSGAAATATTNLRAGRGSELACAPRQSVTAERDHKSVKHHYYGLKHAAGNESLSMKQSRRLRPDGSPSECNGRAGCSVTHLAQTLKRRSRCSVRSHPWDSGASPRTTRSHRHSIKPRLVHSANRRSGQCTLALAWHTKT